MTSAQSRLLDRLAAFAPPGVPIDRNDAVRGPAEQGKPATLSALFLSVGPHGAGVGPSRYARGSRSAQRLSRPFAGPQSGAEMVALADG
jgi:hypothetical protein